MNFLQINEGLEEKRIKVGMPEFWAEVDEAANGNLLGTQDALDSLANGKTLGTIGVKTWRIVDVDRPSSGLDPEEGSFVLVRDRGHTSVAVIDSQGRPTIGPTILSVDLVVKRL